jgi:hypothetical protein
MRDESIDKEQFDMAFDQVYKQVCICKKEHTIITQRDNNPEYQTDVYVLCECGKYVHFILPVN